MTPDAPQDDDLLLDVCSSTGLSEGVVKGICGGLAVAGRKRHDRATMVEMCQTWGASFETVQQLATLRLDDLKAITGGIANSALLNCATAQEKLAQALQTVDGENIGYAKGLAQIAKAQNDMALGWMKEQGPESVINVAVNGDFNLVRELKAMRERERPAAERMAARGVVISEA